MDRIVIDSKTWVLIADGAKALLFRNAGDAQAINLKAVDVLEEHHAATRELGTERAGRSYESAGHGRSAVRAPDYHDLAEADFLGRVAKRMGDVAAEHKIGRLVIVAPPRALAVLRARLTPSVKHVVIGEIDKDLTQMPVPAIEAHLAELGRLR